MDLENLSKVIKKTAKPMDDVSELGNHLGDMQTWLRNLEQHILSLNARLRAIEQRLSFVKKEQISDQTRNGCSELLSNESLSTDLTEEHFSHLNLEITTLNKNVIQLKNQIDSMESFKKDMQNSMRLLEKNKQRPSIKMRFGKKEIPLELSGLIGGFICFLVAALSMSGATDIVLSPWFLTCIGLLLLAGTFLRNDLSVAFIKKIIKIILPHSITSKIYQSDSPS